METEVQLPVEGFGSTPMTAAQIEAQVRLIKSIFDDVFKEGIHYGKVEGQAKASLWKAGAEKLCVMFRLAPEYSVEDLGDHFEARYRIACRLLSPKGVFLGAGIAECSSREDQYQWRAPVNDAEFEYFLDREEARIYFMRDSGGNVQEVKQVQIPRASVANSVLKVAKKRAYVDAVLTVTAASELFTQDLEDMPPELRGRDEPREPRKSAGNSAVAAIAPKESSERATILAALNAAADGGMVSLLMLWRATPEAYRAMVGADWTSIKARAEAATAKTTTNEDAPL